MNKRISCRAIILQENSIFLMHRIKENSEYYTFPGGGIEDNDISKEDCVIREVYEEFGINVEPIRLVYEYISENSMQYFFLCRYISGKLGNGTGPEIISPIKENGKYLPEEIKLDNIFEINLQPIKIKNELIKDVKLSGIQLSSEVKSFIEN